MQINNNLNYHTLCKGSILGAFLTCSYISCEGCTEKAVRRHSQLSRALADSNDPSCVNHFDNVCSVYLASDSCKVYWMFGFTICSTHVRVVNIERQNSISKFIIRKTDIKYNINNLLFFNFFTKLMSFLKYLLLYLNIKECLYLLLQIQLTTIYFILSNTF